LNTEKTKITEIDVWEIDPSGRCDDKRHCGYLIKESHTTEDICRWIIALGLEDDVMDNLSSPDFVNDTKEQ
jgi:hypothetical protein